MQSSWGSYTFLFYAALDLIMAVLVWFFVKETQGRSLEEMESIFHSKAAFDVETARHEGVEPDNISALEVPHKKDSNSKTLDSSD
jgi:Sugar (and other) transporter